MLIAFALVALETERGRQRGEDRAERQREVGQECVRVRQRDRERGAGPSTINYVLNKKRINRFSTNRETC